MRRASTIRESFCVLDWVLKVLKEEYEECTEQNLPWKGERQQL